VPSKGNAIFIGLKRLSSVFIFKGCCCLCTQVRRCVNGSYANGWGLTTNSYVIFSRRRGTISMGYNRVLEICAVKRKCYIHWLKKTVFGIHFQRMLLIAFHLFYLTVRLVETIMMSILLFHRIRDCVIQVIL
jgi:hypothetical protein